MHATDIQKRRIAVLSSSRADFAHLHWPLQEMLSHPDLDPRLLLTGAHLSPEFGATERDILAAGFRIDERVECLLSSDSRLGMAKTIGVATLGLADVLERMRPDLLLLIADRYEMLAPAAVALALRIPMAHIEGGEISEGAIDDAVRNALTKVSHLHFTPTETARRRVLAMGEEAWRVHRVGAPSLDHLRRGDRIGPADLAAMLDLPPPPWLVAAMHPVTLLADTNAETQPFLEALEQQQRSVIFAFPNADAGSRELLRQAQEFCNRHDNARLFVNLPPEQYWSLLAAADLMAGNSSSAIMESPSLGLPAVNVGQRQQGRERADNLIDCPAEARAILEALQRADSPAFRQRAAAAINPYGDGHAGERIATILATCPLGDELLMKRALPLSASSAPAFAQFGDED